MEEVLLNEDWKNIELDYESENDFSSFFSSTGNIHSYPAKAVPNMINSLLSKLLEKYKIRTVLDPFVGSGTVALESKYLGLDFWGSDLNPLSILLARTKVLTIDNTLYVKKRIEEFILHLENEYNERFCVCLEEFERIDFWFKENNIKELSFVKKETDLFIKKTRKYRETFALILLTAFSSTVRQVSLSRKNEFKLYRMSINNINKFNVNAISIFKERVENLLNMLVNVNSSCEESSVSKIYLQNAKKLQYLEDNTIDLIMTSPPYGDSQSTVAYGQFSRLSLQWIGDLIQKYLKINCYDNNCDQYLLGGKQSSIDNKYLEGFYNSEKLNTLICNMEEKVETEVRRYTLARIKLLTIIEDIDNNNYIDNTSITSNTLLLKLIEERVRLDIYRKINNKISNLKSNEIKEISQKQRDVFLKELFSNDKKKEYKRIQQLKSKLPAVLNTINRKIETQPKRKKEIIDFFKDLYIVVKECDRVLSIDGVQTWIVGHRTVFGEITVDMEGILSDWFVNMGYDIITSLERKYSFKRMPHHINSTVSRKNEVKTMMYEYILIVKKNLRKP